MAADRPHPRTRVLLVVTTKAATLLIRAGERLSDQIHRKLLAHLFNGKYDAIEVLKLKQIVDILEEAADAFEHVANTVETIAVKES